MSAKPNHDLVHALKAQGFTLRGYRHWFGGRNESLFHARAGYFKPVLEQLGDNHNAARWSRKHKPTLVSAHARGRAAKVRAALAR